MFEDKNEGSKSEKKLEDKAANNGLTPRVSFFSGQLIISGDVTITSRGEASLNGSLNLVNSRLEADQAFLEGNLNLKNSELVMRQKRDVVSPVEKASPPKAPDNGLTCSGRLVVIGELDISSRLDQESLDGSLNLENATIVERYKKHRPVYTQEHSNIQNNTPANGVISAFGHVCLESEEEGVILNVDPEERSFNV